jgi:hypothetical protein
MEWCVYCLGIYMAKCEKLQHGVYMVSIFLYLFC